MSIDKNDINKARQQITQKVAALESGWYPVSFFRANWIVGPRYSRMSVSFQVERGVRQGKRFQAGITFGLILPGEETVSDANQLVKLFSLCEFIGVDTKQFDDRNSLDLADLARIMNERSGARNISVQIKFWSNEKTPEGYNLVQVRKS